MSRIRSDLRKPPAPAPQRKQRKPLRRVSKKRAKLMREVGPERQARKEALGRCMICGQQTSQLDADEIARGYSRELCLKHPELTLISCRRCHERTQNEPLEKRLARLMLFEIEQRCQTLNELLGTAPTHVTAEGVIGYLMFRKRRR